MTPDQARRRLTAVTIGLFVANALLGWGIWVWPVLPFGSTVLIGPAFVWPFEPMVAVFGLPIASLAALRATCRRPAVQAVLFCAAVSVGSIGGCTPQGNGIA